MCPLWPFHTVIMYLLLLLPLWFASCKAIELSAIAWQVQFSPSELKMQMLNSTTVRLSSSSYSPEYYDDVTVYLQSDNPSVASVPNEKPVLLKTDRYENETFASLFNVTANFLGYANVKAIAQKKSGEKLESDKSLRVIVIKNERLLDKVFLYSVIALVFLLFVNFGCVLDWKMTKETIRRPIGPAIGMFGQFFVMPIVSFVLGQLLFQKSTALQLGFFFVGIAPAGGGSNIWTVLLNGNLNLSISMTAISTLFAFFMMPLWVFTLGRVIFAQGNLVVPYWDIGRSAFSLLIPLAIGGAIQLYSPKFSRFMVRILKPFSGILLLTIILFAAVTNLYLVKLFTWQIVVAGLGLPLLGYLIGGLIARLCNQPPEDVLAISIETGIQNTGVAIYMLRSALGQPEADLTTVAPVAAATMTPIPLIFLFILQRIRKRKLSVTKLGSDAPSEHYQSNGHYTGSQKTLCVDA